MERQYVAFETSGCRFCVDIMDVQEVAREQSITRMPDFPDFVEGVINLRGTVTPIVSIQKKIQSDMKASAARSAVRKYMIVRASGVIVGLVVDVLDKIIAADDRDIQGAEGMGHDPMLVSGLLHVDDIIYLVLNARSILGAEETAALERLEKNLSK